MTETLTESFCERCGTRYTFESSASSKRGFRGMKVLGRGIKHFVTSDSSIDEAIAAARADLERDATNQQLDAFHGTFTFCMSCRQYTCGNCWNESEAKCQSCAPLAPTEIEPGSDVGVDLERLRRVVGTHDHVHLPAMAERVAAPEDNAPPPTLPIDDSVAVLDGAALDDRVDIEGVAPGQSLDDAVAAFEALHAGEAPPDELPVAAAIPTEEPSGSTVEAETEPVSAAPAVPAPTQPPPVIETVAVDSVPQPVWPAPAQPAAPPQWPTGPRWPTGIAARPAAPTPEPAGDALAAIMSRSSTESLWAASSREVLRPLAPAQPPPVQACINCGLSLSANARFCRRCGTSQT